MIIEKAKLGRIALVRYQRTIISLDDVLKIIAGKMAIDEELF